MADDHSAIFARLLCECSRIQLLLAESWQWEPYLEEHVDYDARINYACLEEGRVASWLAHLAHELGHHRSCNKNRSRWQPEVREVVHARSMLNEYDCVAVRDEYEPKLRRLSAEERRGIMEEEERAWRYGRQLLVDAGASDFIAFDEVRQRSLSSYEQVLTQLSGG